MIIDLPITMGAYTQKHSFLVSLLQSTDIIMGIPFCHEHNLDINYHTHTMKFLFNGQHITLTGNKQNENFPLLSHTQVKQALKKENKAYMVYVTEAEQEHYPSIKPEQHEFLDAYHDCFVD